MSDRNHYNEQHLILDRINDSVVADSNSPTVSTAQTNGKGIHYALNDSVNR